MGIRKSFIAAVKAIGLDPELVVRHTLRHTVVSLLIQSGVDIHTVMNITGHKTQETPAREIETARKRRADDITQQEERKNGQKIE